MPGTYTYPGVYVEEIPSGVRTITGVATSTAAFVGYTARGRTNDPVRIYNFGDYERSFGGLDRRSEVSYAVQHFFANGGSEAFVVRVANGASAASVTLKNAGGTNVLQVRANGEGEWGNSVELEVDYDTDNPDSTFNLRVTRYETRGSERVAVESEQFRNLSMNPSAPTYAPSVVEAESRLVRLEVPAGLAVNAFGYSLSRNLSPFGQLQLKESDRELIVTLNGTDTRTLTLTGNLPTTVANLRSRLENAANAAGLQNRLIVERAGVTGAQDNNGNFIRLRGDATGAELASSVEVRPAAGSELASKLGLGRAVGGREVSGAAPLRPRPTGTFGGDLADELDQSLGGLFEVTLTDEATGEKVVDGKPFTATASPVGAPLAAEIQKKLRALDPALAEVTVRFVGRRLQVDPGPALPHATLALSGAGANDAVLSGTAATNVARYSLGVGPSAGGQTGLLSGSDGQEPGAAELLGDGSTTGIHALRQVDLFNLLVVPRTASPNLTADQAFEVISQGLRLCRDRRAFYLIDAPPKQVEETITWKGKLGLSSHGAVFFPRIRVADPLQDYRARDVPASGAVAGVFARTDAERGVWKAPAGTEATLRGVLGPSQSLTDPQNGTLNQEGVNCIRSFPVFGTVVWGARTLEGSDRAASEWKYIPIRRLALFIEESLFRGSKWIVFEPNDEPLWAQIRLNFGAFMHNLFRQGAFQGSSPRQAYFVKCDAETTTQNDRNLGIVNILVGFAPLKPAEFVVIRIQQMAGQIQA